MTTACQGCDGVLVGDDGQPLPTSVYMIRPIGPTRYCAAEARGAGAEFVPVPVDSAVRAEGRKLVVDTCSGCGSQVEADADGPCCPGAEIEQAEVWREPTLPWTAGDEAREAARVEALMADERARWLREVVAVSETQS